jgi:hypothetical protein
LTDAGRRYVECAGELKKLSGNTPRYAEIAGEMDRIWSQLGEPEHDEINGLLIASGEHLTDARRRYVECAGELKKLSGNTPRYAEIVGEMDRIWSQLGESEHDEITGLLIAIDEVERTGNGYPPAECFADEDEES